MMRRRAVLAAAGAAGLGVPLARAAAAAGGAAIDAGPGRAPPPAGAAAGWHAGRLREAIAFAVANESSRPRDLAREQRDTFGREAFGEPIGPLAARGDMTGVVVHRGRVAAQWGEPVRVDMAHSVTKSLLSSVVGVAADRGLIADLHRPVHLDLPPVRTVAGEAIEPFADDHARSITWDHLLRQTSDWEGTLWGKPDWADRAPERREAPPPRPRAVPGSTWRYNDVRANLLALCATAVWRRPLEAVLRETVMDPIGASRTWRWHGYDRARVVVAGRLLAVPSGGGHWGGGLFAHAHDLARFGLLTLRGGRWGDRAVLSPRWVAYARTPTPANPGYGVMNWYLNTGRRLLPSASHEAFMHLGNGANAVVCEPARDLVVVLRWIDEAAIDGVLARLLSAAPSA